MKYLYDDLDDVCLSRELIESPPLELWLEIVERKPMATDFLGKR